MDKLLHLKAGLEDTSASVELCRTPNKSDYLFSNNIYDRRKANTLYATPKVNKPTISLLLSSLQYFMNYLIEGKGRMVD